MDIDISCYTVSLETALQEGILALNAEVDRKEQLAQQISYTDISFENLKEDMGYLMACTQKLTDFLAVVE